MYHPYVLERLSEEKGFEHRRLAAEARLGESVDSGRFDWPRRVAASVAAVVVAFGLLAAGCGEDTYTVTSEADPQPAAAPAVRSVNWSLADLVRINGPYTAPAVKATVMPAWLLSINGPYATPEEPRGAPEWLVDVNGPYVEEGSELVPGNVR
jgi:hypothetical protein